MVHTSQGVPRRSRHVRRPSGAFRESRERGSCPYSISPLAAGSNGLYPAAVSSSLLHLASHSGRTAERSAPVELRRFRSVEHTPVVWCPDNPVDRTVAALPRANGNAPKQYRALPHEEVGAAVEAIRGVRLHSPVGGVVRRDDRVDGGAGRRGARGAVGRDRRGGGAVDDSGVEDEGRARVLGPVEHGRTGCARARPGAVSRIVAGVSLEDRRTVAEERARARAAESRSGSDGSRVPFQRAVVDGRNSGVPAEVAEACLAHVRHRERLPNAQPGCCDPHVVAIPSRLEDSIPHFVDAPEHGRHRLAFLPETRGGDRHELPAAASRKSLPSSRTMRRT